VIFNTAIHLCSWVLTFTCCFPAGYSSIASPRVFPGCASLPGDAAGQHAVPGSHNPGLGRWRQDAWLLLWGFILHSTVLPELPALPASGPGWSSSPVRGENGELLSECCCGAWCLSACFLHKSERGIHIDGTLLRVLECNSGHSNQVEEQKKRLGRSCWRRWDLTA